MRIYFLLVVSLSITIVRVLAQNLVPNPSFEEFTRCPGSYSTSSGEFRPLYWYSANTGTPDAFNECGYGEADVPYNWAGVSEAFDGQGYIGIYVWMFDKEFREYIQCKLLQPLTKDSVYTISYRYKLSSYSKYCIDKMSVLITDTVVKMNHHHGWNVDPTFCACADSVIHERTGLWEHARFEYTAKGGEQYITLGNFADNHTTKTYSIQHRPAQEEMLSKASYYYLDDVVVKLKFDPSDVIPGKEIFSEDEVELNRPYVLKNILFQFNSHKLLARSFEELDQVVSILQKNTNYNVEVNGYTDDIGGDSYNMHLSKKRADTVREYLIHYGVNPDRIKATGYGKRFPVVEGVSEDARRLNRRVEIRFTL